jgi:hypothetical protein
MALIPYAQELGAVYTITGPDGSIAVLNDPTSPYYVGVIEDITGLDSAEVNESFGMKVEDDGGINNNFYFGRRPFTFQGKISPITSATDRATKIQMLMSATNAMRGDATLSWTPLATGAAPVSLKFRRQRPSRTSGSWVKDFFFAGVAEDPNIYSTKLRQVLRVAPTGLTNTYVRSTWVSGVDANAGYIGAGLSFPAAGVYTVSQWVRTDSTWNGGTPSISYSVISGPGVTVKAVTSFNLGTKTTFQRIVYTITTTAACTGYILTNAGAVPSGAGHYLEYSAPEIDSDNNQVVNFTLNNSVALSAGATWTLTYISGAQAYDSIQAGNGRAPPVIRLFGPLTGVSINAAYPGGANSLSIKLAGLTLAAGHYIDVDVGARTVIDDTGANFYSKVDFANTNWGGILGLPTSAGAGQVVYSVSGVTGSGGGTGFLLSFNDAWI